VSGWFAGKDNMAKKMLIDATHPEETRVVVVDGTKVEEFDFESLNKRQLAGNIYLAKVTRVEPSSASRARASYKIQEVIKVRQIMLVQVVKEERGNKGAALTTYLSACGPLLRADAQHRAWRRHLPQDHERVRPQEAQGGRKEIDVPQEGMGLIVRTAGASAPRPRSSATTITCSACGNRSANSRSSPSRPPSIYEEGDLIKRSIRDLYSRDIDEIWSRARKATRAKDFMKMIMPSHAKNVKLYKDTRRCSPGTRWKASWRACSTRSCSCHRAATS
jgi:Ribonuclease G/E